MIALLEHLPADSPCPAPEAWRQVRVPTLVIVNCHDALHPMAYGQRLAAQGLHLALNRLCIRHIHHILYTHLFMYRPKYQFQIMWVPSRAERE